MRGDIPANRHFNGWKEGSLPERQIGPKTLQFVPDRGVRGCKELIRNAIQKLDRRESTKRAFLTRETEKSGRVSRLLASFHQSSNFRDKIVPLKCSRRRHLCASGRKPNAQSSPGHLTGSANSRKFERSLLRGPDTVAFGACSRLINRQTLSDSHKQFIRLVLVSRNEQLRQADQFPGW